MDLKIIWHVIVGGEKNNLTKGVFYNNGTAVSACSLFQSLLERGNMGRENISLHKFPGVLVNSI